MELRLSTPTVHQLSEAISMALHPFLTAPLALVLLLYLDSGNLWQALGYAGLCAALVVVPAIFYIIYKMRRGHYSDADVSVQSERHSLYIFGVLCMAICLGVLIYLGVPRMLMVLFLTALFTLSIFFLISRVWIKISIHTGILAATAAATAFYSVPLAAVFGLAAILLGWARLTLKRHTPAEVALGLIVASVAAVIGMSWR